jgi:hypothetical protein
MGSQDTGGSGGSGTTPESPSRFAREIENDPSSNPPPELDRLRGG